MLDTAAPARRPLCSVIYSREAVNADGKRVAVLATKEVNGWAVYLDLQDGIVMSKWFHKEDQTNDGKAEAIEYAVELASKIRQRAAAGTEGDDDNG